MSLKPFWCLLNVRLVNDPCPSSIVLDVSRIFTRYTRSFVAREWFLAELASDFFKLFFGLNYPPFLACVALCSKYIN
jgi:hypothetical protein